MIDPKPKTGAKKRMVALEDRMVRTAAEALCGRDLPVPTTRETISLAVDKYLPVVVQRLLYAGLVPCPDSTRRPRNIDNSTWQALAEATESVPLGQNELLRCCLILTARGDQTLTLEEPASDSEVPKAKMTSQLPTRQRADTPTRKRPAPDCPHPGHHSARIFVAQG